MKVVLTQKSNLGNIGDVLDVKSGYANNFLLKQGLAVKDSARARQKYSAEAIKKEAVVNKKSAELESAIAKLKKDSVLNIHSKANEQGHLYAAISNEDFIKALESQLGIKIGNLVIQLNTVIKGLGRVRAQFTINNITKTVNINIKDDNQAD